VGPSKLPGVAAALAIAIARIKVISIAGYSLGSTITGPSEQTELSTALMSPAVALLLAGLTSGALGSKSHPDR